MYPQLYPRHLGSVVWVTASEGTAMLIYRGGEIKHFLRAFRAKGNDLVVPVRSPGNLNDITGKSNRRHAG